MDIRRLEAFQKVYELRSFSKAGQELYLSQPTISAHVIALEQELGTQLFDRLGRTILPTQAGDILYTHVLQAFASLGSAAAEIALLQRKVGGEIKIGGSTVPATYLLPGALAEFTRRYPDVRVRLTVGDSQEVIDAVLGGELALGVVGASTGDQDLSFSTLMEDELVVVASRTLPGVAEKARDGEFSIAPDSLREWPWVLREQGSGTRKAFEEALNGQGLDIRGLDTIIEARSHETVMQCVVHGLGLCVSSRLAVGTSLEKGNLVVVTVPGMAMRRSLYVVRHAKRHVFPAMRYFHDFLHNFKG